MFKLSLLKAACLVLFLGLLVGNAGAQTSPVLSVADTILIYGGSGSSWRDTAYVPPAKCATGKFWRYTYEAAVDSFCIDGFNLTHQSGFDIYSYWGGFTTGYNGDWQCYTSKCQDTCNCRASCVDSLGSGDWVKNQWGIMAGGGLDANYNLAPGDPYFICYWDYFSDNIDPNARSLQISLADGSLFNPKEIYICNHPWPYWGNIYGDGFAHPFDNDTCYFNLIITGYDADGTIVGSVTHPLAKGNVVADWSNQSRVWTSVNLQDAGESVQKIVFTMESSDELIIDGVNYGPNTAVYFNMDKLTVEVTGKTATSPTVQKVQTLATPQMIHVTDYFPLTSYTGGDVVVYDAKGKEVWRTTVKAGEKINLSKLPAGDYRLRHGHRVIPFKKVN